jgi:hypothetical protein
MPLDLTSVHAKLRRAIEHAETVENDIRVWGNAKPYRIVHETNSDCTRYSAILRFNEGATEPAIERWSLMVADSIHNFRCVLDHLVYAVAVAESQDPPPHADKLQFPICDDKTGFAADIKRWRLGKISDPMRAAFELFQPYNRPYPKLPPLLSMLRDFENTDKHKLLRVLFSAVASGDIGFTGPAINHGTRGSFIANKGEIKDGAEVAAFVFDRPTPDMKYDRTEFLIVFALSHGKTADGVSDRDDAVSLLHIIGKEVRTVVDSIAANF